ncbi:hypothetical protein [Synechococcus sp. PCC 6312]|uniref:hypothetical protein n=1 Tax=Synechococcus sp. (strain ATCC 27167 / PCC 6312) TaxID=195253 RepID=UPI00030B1120|nr:hypothetical protein [Synechococcus sp. PCC 6312]
MFANYPVTLPNAHKVDPAAHYPCPCRQNGELIPIVLTEALGCQRCQQIFVVRPDGYSIEQLVVTYPYKRIWYWTGLQWQALRRGLGDQPWLYTLGLLIFLLLPILLWVPLLFQASLKLEIMIWVVLAIAMMLFPALLIWVALSRH